ncbi:hypothetical protein A2U01_0103776, partial [Trifolium medium]|nr:hypothetical protein [Trifolium medium]
TSITCGTRCWSMCTYQNQRMVDGSESIQAPEAGKLQKLEPEAEAC